MHTEQLISVLDDPQLSEEWLRKLGFRNLQRGQANLDGLARSGLTLDLLASLLGQLEQFLPGISDPDRALNNLERFIADSRNPLAFGALLDRDPTGIPILLTIFSTSQYLSDLLIRDPESYDALRLAEGQLHTRQILVDEICNDVRSSNNVNHIMAILRRFKRRETLRIAFGDMIVGQRIEQVTQQISYVADAVCEAALQWSFDQLKKKWGTPKLKSGEECGLVVIALGKLGGTELNYSSDIDLIVVYQADGQTDQGKSNRQFFDRLTRDFAKLMNESTGLGAAYRVDLRLRPEGNKGPVCNSVQSLLQYYDLKGRTWERQALIKARPIAGDLKLGEQLIERLQPWIYRRHLRRIEIEGVKALKRQIERRALVEGESETNVKVGHGGIRDIEFVIQFLQLLHGGSLREVRCGNTLEAIRRLERAGCLTMQEASLLHQNYNWLRKLEHRLQIMFDLQTHTLPTDPQELTRTARRMGYREYFGQTPLHQFEQQLAETTRVNRKILDHLLHEAFSPIGDSDDDDVGVPLTVDLVLDPDPTAEMIAAGFAPYRFRDVPTAFKNLMALSRETTAFLSARRCRHFLAAIAPSLLEHISQTPDPDFTLINLRRVSDSLGAKGVLWELFNFNPASLDLYVRLCASSDYLAGILKSNPGMIDELIDSLLLASLPTLEGLQVELDDLTHGAEDHDPIIQSFKHAQHLCIGIRDILGRDEIRATHRALSDVAEICVRGVTRIQFDKLIARHGRPGVPFPSAEESGFVILALGKLGGREPNYHSDLDVIFLYEGVESLRQALKPEITLQYFFGQLAANIIKFLSEVTRYGKLYEIDCRLRPTGKSGALAVSTEEFLRYFETGKGQLWERQALCKARAVFGSDELCDVVSQLVRRAITITEWSPGMAEQISDMRKQMQRNCSARNLKRGIGGTVDIEFASQMLQIKFAAESPDVLRTETLQAIEALEKAGALSGSDAKCFTRGYRLLRSVESRLRLMNTSARHDLPEPGIELEKLAYLLGRKSGQHLENEVATMREKIRTRFDRLFRKHSQQ